jgi:hypothetical protein
LAESDDVLEESLECRYTKSSTDASRSGIVRQRFVQGVAHVPTVGQVQGHHCPELALRTQAFKEENELQLEKDDRVNTRSATIGLVVLDSVAKGQVQLGIEKSVEVIRWNKGIQGDNDGLVETTQFRWTKHPPTSWRRLP